MVESISGTKHYFVDESGTPEIFDKWGNVIVGEPGCSKFFFLGFLDVKDPKTLRSDIRDLRKKVVKDPYFGNIPSMQPGSKKTYYSFHAKDDIQEIRREVFRLLESYDDLCFIAVVKDKLKVVQYATERKIENSEYNYNPNELYDLLTRRLFKNHLHLASEYIICYSIRGKKPRTNAFGDCLETAQQRFIKEHQIESSTKLVLLPTESKNEPCLQATDYFLWALQRFYEKNEIRYLEYLKEKYKLIIDIDDTRNNPYGEYYDSKRNIINLERILR